MTNLGETSQYIISLKSFCLGWVVTCVQTNWTILAGYPQERERA